MDKILIVDDNHSVLKILSSILKFKGYDIITADRGSQALEKIKEEPVLALLDLKLQDMEGFDILREIKKNYPFIECIILTGHSSEHSVIEAINLGAYGYIQKSNDTDQLLHMVKRAIEKSSNDKALRESEERYRELFHSSSVSLWEEDWREVKKYFDRFICSEINDIKKFLHEHPEELNYGFYLIKIKDVNRVTLSMFEAENKEELFRNANKIFTEDFYRALLEGFRAFAEGATYYEDEADCLTLKGRKFYIAFQITPVKGYEKSLEKIIVSIMDITKIKENEKALKKAQDEKEIIQRQLFQQEKMASIGYLAAGVAHEINNPTGFISGNLRALDKYINKFVEFIDFQNDIIKKSASPETMEEIKKKRNKLKIDYVLPDVKELIKESLEGTERISKIVKDLKSFSRLDEKDDVIMDLNECLEKTLNIVWNELKYKAEIKKAYGKIPPTRCHANQLSQVFMNMLINASHAIEERGEIRIKTWLENKYIFISISDTGCGIEEEILNKIFDPFFTTKEQGKGTGMGLSISYDIIKKHNGEIFVTSTPGKGSEFTIKIPVNDKP